MVHARSRKKVDPLTALEQLRIAARACMACPLWQTGTQTVFGEGSPSARLMLVGDRLYVTNAVKHFKWIPRGKRRLHQKPSDREVGICTSTWLQQEISTIRPELIVCLGATAAKALLGRDFRVTRDRGHVLEHGSQRVLATVHPSSLLRIADATEREQAYKEFVADLMAAIKALPKARPRVRDPKEELPAPRIR